MNNTTVDTINAAASAIVSAESRSQPPPMVEKRRWGGCWSLYWCFGSQKSSKRIGHAVLVPEPEVPRAAALNVENQAQPTSLAVLPFIAPPSSPASFLQSDPSSATHSPAGLLSLTSLSVNAYSPGGHASIFATGPYAHETQLVTPPAFSAFTTQPSTAPFTPPPESVQLTTPSSPEVPFAQLLTSSLERARRNSGTNQKFALFHYDQPYPGSPGAQLISPGSIISNSGTSSPFPDRYPIPESPIAMREPPKVLGFEHFTTHKWGSRFGSGSVTPDGVGLGSRLASGSVTPDGTGLGSRLASGSVTPDGVGLRSRLGSGSLTPDYVGPAASQEGLHLENRISEVASLANSDIESKVDEPVVNHRVSFELSGEEVARCLANKTASSRTLSECHLDNVAADESRKGEIVVTSESCLRVGETSSETAEKPSTEIEEEHTYKKHRSITFGSAKEFNFDNSKGEVSDKPTSSAEWWANETIVGKEARSTNSWTFFPLLQPEVS